MEYAEFRTEMHRMAEVNGIYYLKEDKLVALMDEDVRGGASFRNIFRGTDKRDLLLVTSHRTLTVTSGAFSVKLKWSVPHSQLLRVDPSRRTKGGYVITAVQLQTKTGLQEFWMGFHQADDYVGLDIAAQNTDVAVEQIGDAALPEPAIAVAAPGSPGMGFDLLGPEQAGEAARQAYGTARFAEAFRLYVTAIDRLHDFYVYEQFRNREPGPKDAWLVDGLVSALGAARASDPTLDVREGVREATHRLRTIASAVEGAGGSSVLYRRGLDGLTTCASEIDVADVFWT